MSITFFSKHLNYYIRFVLSQTSLSLTKFTETYTSELQLRFSVTRGLQLNFLVAQGLQLRFV
jgi:hypothetical protein